MILDDYLDRIFLDPEDTVALTNVAIWIIRDFNGKGHNPTDREVYEKLQLLLLDRVCEPLVKQGLLDVYFDEKGEVSYQITEKGTNALNDAKNP
jgi:predicted transcriptional regulator